MKPKADHKNYWRRVNGVPMQWYRTLRFKVLLVAFLSSISFLLLFFFNQQLFYDSITRVDGIEDLNSGERLFRNYIKKELALMEANADLIAKQELVINSLGNGNKDELKANAEDNFDSLQAKIQAKELGFYDPFGENLLTLGEEELEEEEIDELMSTAISGGKSSGGIKFNHENDLMLCVVVPVVFSGETVGFIEITKDIDSVAQQFSQEADKDVSILIDSNVGADDFSNQTGESTDDDEKIKIGKKTIVFSSMPADFFSQGVSRVDFGACFSDEAMLLAEAGLENFQLLHGKGGLSYQCKAWNLRGDGNNVVGVLVVGDDNSQLLAQNNKSFRILLAALSLLGFFYVVLGLFLLEKKIVLPISRLSEAARKIAAGKGKILVDVVGSSELSALSRAFNYMVQEVFDSRAEIERKVEEQTKLLQERKIDLENQQKAILNILEDVEDEKDVSEKLARDLERFKLAVDNASDHIIITDANGSILYANRAAEKITGYNFAQMRGNKPSLWGRQMTPGYYKKLWKTIKEEKIIFVGNLTNLRNGGERYEAEIRISPILDASGEVKFFVGIERDVTREREIDRAKTEFVSLASHQLRTPLTAIKWHTEMMLSRDAGKISKEQEELLNEIYHSNERMIDLVNSLLNVSRIEMGTFAVEPEPLDLKKLLASVLSEVQISARLKKLTIVQKFSEELPQIRADQMLLRIVLQNLLSNAVKYTRDSGEIVVGAEISDGEFVISVADNGYGIPRKDQPKIFSKLFRADNAKELDADGSGLGLYVTKAIVEQSGGKIWFESRENIGTTFYLTLPLSGMVKKEGSRALIPNQAKN